jgi:hypothetical protein
LAVVLAAAAFAAGFLAALAGFLAAACAEEAAAKRKMTETENATRRGNLNLGVIETSSLKKQSRSDRPGDTDGGERPAGQVKPLRCT